VYHEFTVTISQRIDSHGLSYIIRNVRLEKHIFLPVCLMVVFALSRWPGLMPPNFSAVYALVFCAGVFFSGRSAWYLPLLTLFLTDLSLNLYYHVQGWEVFTSTSLLYTAGNYFCYGVLIILGRLFRRFSWENAPQRNGFWARLASWLTLIGGGLLGALLFYLITNTLAWFFNPFGNPEYIKTISGWIQAMTGGTAGWPQTWQFFKSTLGSSGLFTGLFAGAMHLADAMEQKEHDPEEDEEEEHKESPKPRGIPTPEAEESAA